MKIAEKRKLLLTLLVAVLGLNLLIGWHVHSQEIQEAGEDTAFEKISMMMRVLHLLRKDYVDPEKVDFSDLIYSALTGMVRSLDPFSDFMPPEAYQSMMETTEGEFGGLGIIVTVRDNVLTIVAPIEDTPGAKAGLMAGDQILRVDDTPADGLDLHEIVKLLKGEPGTSVTITIFRPDTEETKEVTVERALIPIVSIKDVRVLEGNIGYIRILQFNEPTADDLWQALQELEQQNVKSLILDLRNNPGGLLDSSVNVCSFFLPPKKLVVSTEGRQQSQKRTYYTSRGRKFPQNKPIAILVNGGSASAAEIVAGCLKDWGRAVLVGSRTFGKGSVQNVIELPDGSALRLTTAMYYTPSKKVIHEHGIEPNIEVTLTDEEKRALIEQQAGISEKPVTDRQLQRAIDTLNSYGIYLQAAKGKFPQPIEDNEKQESAEQNQPEPVLEEK